MIYKEDIDEVFVYLEDKFRITYSYNFSSIFEIHPGYFGKKVISCGNLYDIIKKLSLSKSDSRFDILYTVSIELHSFDIYDKIFKYEDWMSHNSAISVAIKRLTRDLDKVMVIPSSNSYSIKIIMDEFPLKNLSRFMNISKAFNRDYNGKATIGTTYDSENKVRIVIRCPFLDMIDSAIEKASIHFNILKRYESPEKDTNIIAEVELKDFNIFV